jgi:hypothetical protein
MRAQAFGITGDLDHELEIVLDAAAVEEKGGRGDLSLVFDVEPRRTHDFDFLNALRFR